MPYTKCSAIVNDDSSASWTVIRIAKDCIRCHDKKEADVIVWYVVHKDGSIKIISKHGSNYLDDKHLLKILKENTHPHTHAKKIYMDDIDMEKI